MHNEVEAVCAKESNATSIRQKDRDVKEMSSFVCCTTY